MPVCSTACRSKCSTQNGSVPLASGPGFAITSYSFNGQVIGDTCPKPRIPLTVPDGASNTALIFERYAICGQNGEVRTWGNAAGYTPHAEVTYLVDRNNDNPKTPGLEWVNKYVTKVFQIRPTPAGCQASRVNAATPHGAMCISLADGSSRTIGAEISLATLRAIITPGGGDVIGSDWN